MGRPDVVVVGAGAAGLAAAGELRRHGREVLLLEAHRAIGGRARTLRPDTLNGTPFDEGATWLHQVDRNPLVTLARNAGETLHPGHAGGRALFVGNNRASDAEEREYAHSESAWRTRAECLAAEPDRPLAAVADQLDPADPWLGNIEMWEGSIIAAADARRLSLHDWHRNQLDESDLRPADGVGALLGRMLADAAGPAHCGIAVRTIDWRCGDAIRIETDNGTVESAGCIVTVSTGVLRDERIRFTPVLPREQLAALDGLPMGLLSKLALFVPPEARFAIEDGALLEQRLRCRNEAAMLLSLRPDDATLLTGFLGGDHAWSFAGRERESLHEARDRLASMLGHGAADAIGREGHVSHWGSDPLFLGAYAFARPGHAGARAALGEPFADGRIILAGEATQASGLAGTVGGAMHEGVRAARSMLRTLCS